jgi:hypothetical protein
MASVNHSWSKRRWVASARRFRRSINRAAGLYRIARARCRRTGAYRRETLAPRFGDMVLPNVLIALTPCQRGGDDHPPAPLGIKERTAAGRSCSIPHSTRRRRSSGDACRRCCATGRESSTHTIAEPDTRLEQSRCRFARLYSTLCVDGASAHRCRRGYYQARKED